MQVKSIVHNKTRLATLQLVSTVLFVIMMFAFCFTGYIATRHPQLAFDITIVAWLQSIRSSFTTRCMLAITFFGSRYFLFPGYTILVVYYLFIQKKLWFGVAIAFTGFLGNQLLYLMQDVFERVRPGDPLINTVNGYSYPSGHSLASFVFAGLLCFLVWQKRLQTKWKLALAIVLFCIASTIAVSRAYLHVHYPTDVLGGFYLAILWLIPCWWILYFVDKRYR
jgi:undecaprenyl-diphosphatase